jgi:SAM-dependent methyltransferase
MPNDQSEQTRLSIVHQIYLLILDGQLTKSPLPPDITHVLDVGTGPGDWALAMGEQYPDAEIIASDISVFDDDPASVAPPNVSFQIDDAESEWTYREGFDFIHFRGLSGAFTDWACLYRQAFTHLKPGGYVEISDFDLAADVLRMPNAPLNSYFSIFVGAIRSAADEAGYPRGLEHLRASALTAAGFVDIRTFEIDVPVGTWPQDTRMNTLGKMALIALLESLESTSMRPLTRQKGWNADEVRDLCDKVKTEIVAEVGAAVTVKVVVARKPTE